MGERGGYRAVRDDARPRAFVSQETFGLDAVVDRETPIVEASAAG